MRREHPESVMLPAERVQAGAFGHVPHPDALVLGVTHDKLLSRMKQHAGDVVVVTAACVNLPCL